MIIVIILELLQALQFSHHEKLSGDIRQQLAKRYLRESYSVEQITYMLGFSEPSVFRKAFKKWAGVTPREYRQSAVSGLLS